jgi:hypothetical protein
MKIDIFVNTEMETTLAENGGVAVVGVLACGGTFST